MNTLIRTLLAVAATGVATTAASTGLPDVVGEQTMLADRDGLVLAARDDDETGDATDATEGPVTTPPPPADELADTEGAAARVGFIGLPPEGATPNTPVLGELLVWIRSCHAAPTGELSAIDRLPLLAELYVLADGRLIWQKYEDLPEGANPLSTGLLEQRLTPEGVELMQSEVNAAISSGEPQHCGPRGRDDVYDVYAVADGGAQSLSGDNEHLARAMDPWSWLPATAWEDPEIRAYVPSTYLVTFTAEVPRIEPDQLNAQLPAAAVNLIDTKVWDYQQVDVFWLYATFTTDEARALAAALDDAGLGQDGLLNAYQLDYHFEYHDETRDTVVHIVFRVFDFEAMLREAAAPPAA